ncbi:MAG TPA: helix-turn-helix domain-containing protein [Anaerolineae bacterium]|nr:helix-turn-helix domain-containing protein [Anaerolineae bacterium]
MENLGNWLRTAREARGISLQDVEAVTRIRTRYLEALETGDYGAMPGGEPQVRGFLRRYATFLGLPPEEAIARYEHEAYGERAEAVPAIPADRQPAPSPGIAIAPSPWRGLQVIAVVGVVALLILGGGWLLVRSGLFAGQGATPAPVAATEAVPTSTERVPTPDAGTETITSPQATPTFPIAASGGITITLEPLEHIWVRVTADGFTAFEGMLSPGSPQSWVAEELAVVETGNGAGLIVVVNGQPQGPLCGRGEVCARGWGPEGELEVLPPSPSTATTEGESP